MATRNYSFSKILSYILHPLSIPTIATLALIVQPGLYSITIPVTMIYWFLSVVFLFTLLLPVAGVLLLLKFSAVYSVEMNNRAERTIPLLIACTSYMVLLYILRPTGIPPVFLYLLYSATFALLAGLLINLAYKISLHTLGWSALTATLISISLKSGASLLIPVLISVILSGVAGYARLKQDAHSHAQVYSGYAAGVCVIILISNLG